jgi:hypothetical protein
MISICNIIEGIYVKYKSDLIVTINFTIGCRKCVILFVNVHAVIAVQFMFAHFGIDNSILFCSLLCDACKVV